MKKRVQLIQLMIGIVTVLICSSSFAGNSKKVVLVSLFENLSKEKAVVTYEANATANLDFRKKSFSVDRYSEIPRSLLEDKIIEIGGEVIERQSLNKLLLENKFISESGLVDTTTAIEVGKMLGANTLVIGTIIDINKERKNFSGYGITTDSILVTTNIRTRIVDIETGKILYSKTGKGSASASSDSGEAPIYESIENAVQKVTSDEKFMLTLQN